MYPTEDCNPFNITGKIAGLARGNINSGFDDRPSRRELTTSGTSRKTQFFDKPARLNFHRSAMEKNEKKKDEG